MGSTKDPAFLRLPAILSTNHSNHISSNSLRPAKMFRFLFRGNTISSNNTNSFNNVLNYYTVTNERPEILAWLSPLEPRLRHKDIQGGRVKNIGEWVLQTEEFKSWYSSSEGSEIASAVLFCCGDSGVGKTFIR